MKMKLSRSYQSSSARTRKQGIFLLLLSFYLPVSFAFAPKGISATFHTNNAVVSSSKLFSSNEKSLSNSEISRYSRHLVLSDVGVKGQTAFKNSSILVIGAGGLGSPCLLYLAAAGIGTIGIVDADTVDESNLQRQIIHGTSTIGVSKCQSAKRQIEDINPYCNVITFEKEFTSETAHEIMSAQDWDVVIDGSDNFPTKYLINDACDIHNVPWVYSAILAFEGQISVFNYKDGPTYRDMMPVPPDPGAVPSCAEGGVLGVLPGVFGCLQATEALKILLVKGKVDGYLEKEQGLLVGRILIYDALKMLFTEVGVQKLHDREEILELIDYQGFCAGPSSSSKPATSKEPKKEGRTMDEAESDDSQENAEPEFHSLIPTEALDKLRNGWSPWVMDVRLQTEHDIVALPFTDIVSPHRTVQVHEIPVDGDVLVYCKAGVRGKKACKRLIDLGVDADRLYNLDGGIMRWRTDVDSSMPKY